MEDALDQDQETVAQAEALALRLRAAVQQTAAYRQWQAAEQLVRTLKGETNSDLPNLQTMTAIENRLLVNWNRHFRNAAAHGDRVFYGGGVAVPAKPKRLSQADAAEIALRKAEKPLSTAEIVTAIQAEGAHVGGTDPLVNVSSTLSKDDRFESHRWGRESVWWLAGQPIPANAELHQRMMDLGLDDEGAGGQTPAVVESK